MKLSVQIYSIRNVGDLDAQLALLREAGYQWVESVATHDLTPSVFAAKLKQYGLQLSSMHASLQKVEEQRAELIEACKLTGCDLVIMPWLPMGDRPCTAAGWSALGSRLDGIGRAFAVEGIRFGYHNHEFEFLSYGGKTALELIFETADPKYLGWEADMGWVTRAGGEVEEWDARLGHRLVALHAKDVAADGMARDEDGWATLGTGIVPWKQLFPLLRKRTDLFVFEHDNPSDAFAHLSDSLAFMKQHLG